MAEGARDHNIRGGLTPRSPLHLLQDHAGRCLTGLLQGVKERPWLAHCLSQWQPSRLQHSCGRFISDAGRRLSALKLPLEQAAPASSQLACLSSTNQMMASDTETTGRHLFDIASSTESIDFNKRDDRQASVSQKLDGMDVSRKLDGVPVYTVCNPHNEVVLVSDSKNQRSLSFFCFRRSDAEALLEQVKVQEPLSGQGAKVVAVPLTKVYKLNAEGIAFRFLPDPHQVKNALQIKEKEGTMLFDGVPIFQANNLIIRSNEVRYSPIFFCKEDLDQALLGALNMQQKVNSKYNMNTNIQVGSLEKFLKSMEENKVDCEWQDAVFVPPGMLALSQLETSKKTSMG